MHMHEFPWVMLLRKGLQSLSVHFSLIILTKISFFVYLQ